MLEYYIIFSECSFYPFLCRTALHWACKRGHVTVVEYLLRSGADVKIVSKECESVVDVTSNEQVLELLAKHGTNIWNIP